MAGWLAGSAAQDYLHEAEVGGAGTPYKHEIALQAFGSLFFDATDTNKETSEQMEVEPFMLFFATGLRFITTMMSRAREREITCLKDVYEKVAVEQERRLEKIREHEELNKKEDEPMSRALVILTK